MLSCFNQKFLNDVHLALCFTTLFTAFNTQSHIQKTLTVSIQQDNPSYHVDGYVCFGIIYTFLAFGMWTSPSFIAVAGWKLSLTIGAFCYLSFVSFCYFEIEWLTYCSSAITGIGAALLWTAQANYVVLNSEIGNLYQSISLFWIFYEISYLTGNLFVYFLFNDAQKQINKSMRGEIALVLTAFVMIAVVMLFFLREPLRKEDQKKSVQNPFDEFKKSYFIFKSKHMIIFSASFICCGINLTFMSVLAASLGFSKYLSSNSREYAPLSGVMQGFGEIIGSCLSLYLKEKTFLKLNIIMTIGYLSNGFAYVISFLGLPDTSVYTYTDEIPLVNMPIILLLLSNVLVGIGDACMHIATYNYIGTLYPNDSAPGFAVFKFIRCLATAGSFYYSNVIGLHLQLIILIGLSFLGLIGYHYSLHVLPKTASEEKEKSVQSSFTPSLQYQAAT